MPIYLPPIQTQGIGELVSLSYWPKFGDHRAHTPFDNFISNPNHNNHNNHNDFTVIFKLGQRIIAQMAERLLRT